MLSLRRSIAVIGPEIAGKGFICKKVGIPLRTGRTGSGRTNLRYRLRAEAYPEMEHYVLSICSNVDDLSIDMPENVGLLVFNLDQVLRLDSWEVLPDYQLFFESLEKAIWLGMEDYVLAITHLDLCPELPEPAQWFLSIAKRVMDFLTDGFRVRVHGCVPIGRDGAGNLVDIPRVKDSTIIGAHHILDLTTALKLLISIDRQRNDQLWAAGKIERAKTKHKSPRITIDRGRGRGVLRNNEFIKIYPGEIPCNVLLSEKGGEFDLRIQPTAHDYDLSGSSKVVLVSSNSNPLLKMGIDVHALLRGGLDIAELERKERNLKFSLFGQEGRKGDIIRIRPLRLVQAKHQGAIACDQARKDLPGYRQPFGDEVDLRIDLQEQALVRLYQDDLNAGRVLIWEEMDDGDLSFIGAGRIFGFPDLEIEDIVHQMLYVDQLRFQYDQQRQHQDLYVHKLQQIYHTSSNALISINWPDYDTITRKKEYIAELFGQLIADVRSMINHLEQQDVYTFNVRFVPHLIKAKQHLSSQYDQLTQYGNVSQFDHYKVTLREEHIEYTTFIRKCSDRPFIKHIKSAVEQFTKNGVRVVIHNQLHDDYQRYAFYPKNPYILESLEAVILELLTNSQKALHEPLHRYRGDDFSAHVFIDPPRAQDPNYLEIFYCDSGIFDANLLGKLREKIESREGQFCTESDKLHRHGAQLSLLETCMGTAPTFLIRIPVWFQCPNRVESVFLELVDILSAVDFEFCRSWTKSSLFLVRLAQILRGTPTAYFQKELKTLWNDTQNTVEWTRKWSLRILSALSRLSTMEEAAGTRDEVLHGIAHLTNRPVLTSIRTAIGRIKEDFAGEEVNIDLVESDIPPHMMESARTFRSLTRALYWGLRELIVSKLRDEGQCRELSFSARLMTAGGGNEIEIMISGSCLARLSMELLPLQSRMTILGIKSSLLASGANFNLGVPVKIIP